jgi:hypothetical protein
MVERAFLASPAPAAGNQVVAAPAQFVFTGTEALRLTVFRMSSGITLGLTGRFRSDASGQVTPFSEAIADAVIAATGDSHEYGFPAGQLYNVRVGVTSAAGEFGLTFVRLEQIVGRGDAAVVIGTLLQGYVSPKSELAWPGSPLQHVYEGRGDLANLGWSTVTGASLYATRPGVVGRRYQMLAGRVDILTSAVAGGRAIYLSVQDGGGTVHHIASAQTTLAGSAGRTICFAAGMPARALDVGSIEWLPIAQDLDLTSSLEVRVQVTNNQAGDTITGQGFLVRQWFDG